MRAKLISFEVRGSWINPKTFEWSFRDPVVCNNLMYRTLLERLWWQGLTTMRSSHLRKMLHPSPFMHNVPPNNVKMQHPFYDEYACWLNDAAINNQKIDCEPLLRRNFEVFFSQKLFACLLNLACCPLPNQSSQFTSLQWRATSRKQKLEINSGKQPKHIFHISSHLLHCHQDLWTEETERNENEVALRCIAVYSDALLSTEMRQIFYFSCTAFTCCCRIFCFLSVQQINIRCFSREHLPRWPKAIKMIWPISQSHCPP